MIRLTSLLLLLLPCLVQAQVPAITSQHTYTVLPADGVLQYQPERVWQPVEVFRGSGGSVSLVPLVNFFFRPEFTTSYKETALPTDTSQYNFYLRADLGTKLMLPHNIDIVINAQSFGTYTTVQGPLDRSFGLYEGYADIGNIGGGDMSLRFGRASIGKYGTEMIVGDDDFTRGRSLETVRLRHENASHTGDLIWAQMYQFTTDTVNGARWGHPVFFSTFHTFPISDAVSLDVNLPTLIDQRQGTWATWTLMPDVRLFGASSGFRYSAELIYQTGWGKGVLDPTLKADISAYAAEASVGYNFDNGFGIDATIYRASGDDNLADASLKSFNSLWQNTHRRFGHIDIFKGSNVQAMTLHLNYKIGQDFDLGLNGIHAQVVSLRDNAHGIATKPLGALNLSDKTIGMGGDVFLNYYLGGIAAFQFSFSVFAPGDYMKSVVDWKPSAPSRAAEPLNDIITRTYIIAALRI